MDLEPPERDDWMKINTWDIEPYVYGALQNAEMFYVNYRPPEHGPVGSLLVGM